MNNVTWSPPYYGIQHTGKDKRGRWCTVEDYKNWARLSMWFPGCAFHPMESDHDTAEDARAAGEKWLAEME